MCRNWGYEALHKKLFDLAMSEMKDARQLIAHILYLEGLPNVQRMGQVQAGENALEHLRLDLQLEVGAVQALAEAIPHCAQVGDFTTRNIFEEMIRDEETHVDWFETQLEAIRQVGLENYLTEQLA